MKIRIIFVRKFLTKIFLTRILGTPNGDKHLFIEIKKEITQAPKFVH
jgi:hypothetical protein